MFSLGSCQLRSHFTVSWEKGTKRNKNINSWWNLITVPYAVSTNKVFQKKKIYSNNSRVSGPGLPLHPDFALRQAIRCVFIQFTLLRPVETDFLLNASSCWAPGPCLSDRLALFSYF
jgi:hypothetical protein